MGLVIPALTMIQLQMEQILKDTDTKYLDVSKVKRNICILNYILYVALFH